MTTTNKICPVCGKSYEYALSVNYNSDGTQTCRHDQPSENKIEKRRKENRILSMEAKQQAAQFARTNPREEVITVKDPNPNRGQSTQVPKKLVDNLAERIKPVIGS